LGAAGERETRFEASGGRGQRAGMDELEAVEEDERVARAGVAQTLDLQQVVAFVEQAGSDRGRERLGRLAVPDHLADRRPVDPDANVVIVDPVLVAATLEKDRELRQLGRGGEALDDEVMAL